MTALIHSLYRPPPGTQSRFERFSVAFFTRPRSSVVLRHLGQGSDMIARAVAKAPEGEFDTGTTSADWVARRIRKLRLKNRQVGGYA